MTIPDIQGMKADLEKVLKHDTQQGASEKLLTEIFIEMVKHSSKNPDYFHGDFQTALQKILNIYESRGKRKATIEIMKETIEKVEKRIQQN